MNLKLLAQLSRNQPDKIPPGWFTASQLAIRDKLSKRAVKDIIFNARAKKIKIEEKSFKIRRSDGVIAHVPHYRL